MVIMGRETVGRSMVSMEVGVCLLLSNSVGFGITDRALFDRTRLVALGKC